MNVACKISPLYTNITSRICSKTTYIWDCKTATQDNLTQISSSLCAVGGVDIAKDTGKPHPLPMLDNKVVIHNYFTLLYSVIGDASLLIFAP